MALTAFLQFSYKLYIREHRYLRELIGVVVFSIFFGAFMTTPELDDDIWIIFTVFAVLMNLLTAPSILFMETGNTLYFLIGKPDGRQKLFRAKVLLIVLIDLLWVFLYACVYGVRFLDPAYFLALPMRLGIIGVILLLATLLMSIAYIYRPQLGWLIFALIVFGNITNKAGFFPIESIMESPKLAAFLLPPFLELNFLAVSLELNNWKLLFLGIALLQIVLLWILLNRRLVKKDFL